jgi:hypothetical protein
VKSIAYSVSGKARYAQSVEVKAESLNFVAHASVENGVQYVAPADVGGLMRIDLTRHYRDLARRDPAAFERECGDGFVSAIHAGAELTAVLAFSEHSSTKRKELEASMKGSGWGFSAQGKASIAMNTSAGTSALTISYHQTGGQGNPSLPIRQASSRQSRSFPSWRPRTASTIASGSSATSRCPAIPFRRCRRTRSVASLRSATAG